MRWAIALLVCHRVSALSSWMILLTLALMAALRRLFPAFRFLLTVIEGTLILLFATHHLFTFYLLFEIVLIPVFAMLVFYQGGRHRRWLASLWLVLFTLLGSFFFLMALLTIYLLTGTLDIRWLSQVEWHPHLRPYLFWSIFAALAIKLPVFPAHLWLTEAHVESSTPGSVILAALLLKLGSYGILQFLLPLTPLTPGTLSFIYTLGLLGVWYGGWMSLRQTDLKKLIAYSSISHMGLNLIGLFSQSVIGVLGAILMIFSHAFSALGLFFLAGALAHRTGSKQLVYHRGLAQVMPLFATMWAIYHLFNLGFPGSLAFVAELCTFLGLTHVPVVMFLGLGGVFLSGATSMWLLARTMMGPLTPYLKQINDLHSAEMSFLTGFAILSVWTGLHPDLLLNSVMDIPFLA